MINENLVKFSELNVDPKIAGEDDDGADFDDGEEEWPSHLPVDIHPSVFMKNLPRFDDGAYNISYYDYMPTVEEEWVNETAKR